MRTYVVSAYDTETGFHFVGQVDAPNEDVMLTIFHEMYPNGDITEYWEVQEDGRNI